jgi:hypothetical protein
MLNFLTQDRPTFYAKAETKLAAYGKSLLDALRGQADAQCWFDRIEDLSVGVDEVLRCTPTVDDTRCRVLLAYLVEEHALDSAALAPFAAIPFSLIQAGGSGGPVTWNSILFKPLNLVYGPVTAASVSGLTQFVLNLLSAQPSGVTAHNDLTGIQKIGTGAGVWHLDDFYKDKFVSLFAQAASVGLTLSPSGAQELGTTLLSVTLLGSYNAGTEAAPTGSRYKRNGSPLAGPFTPPTLSPSATATNLIATTTLRYEVDFPDSGSRAAESTIPFYAPSYYGAVATPTPSTVNLQNLGKNIWAPAGRRLTFNCAGTYPCFVEPQDYGIRGLIKDKNGFPITGDVLRSAVTMPLLNGDTVACWQYIHRNPQTDANFIFEL